MRALNKKLIRDLVAMKGQVLAIGAVMACGIAVFVMSTTTLVALTASKSDYYANQRFADMFVNVNRAPIGLAARVAEIDGVAAAEDRVVEALTLDMPGMAEPATGRAISLPPRPNSGLNQVFLRSGRWPTPNRAGEVIISETFAKAHSLVLGSKLRATLRGRRQLMVVVGIALSPEYVIQVEPGSLFPDDRRFGIFWMARRQLEAASDMKGAFNDLSLQLSTDAKPEEIIRKVDNLLKPYGGTGTYTHKTHPSARFVEDELKELRTMAQIPPAIFLSVSAFLLNISLRRILALQREQIAALKAFGYSNFEISAHYAKMISSIVVLGSIVGCAVGTWMARGMAEMYTNFIHFPITIFDPDPRMYLIAIALALAAGFLGMFGGIRATVKLPPAEAMQSVPPATYKPLLIERLGLQRFFSQPARMVIREIERRPVKAILTSLGIAFACAILVVGNFGKDAIYYLMDFQFGMSERDDARVQFVETRPARALHELESIEGVVRAEPFRTVPVRIHHGTRSKQLGITGIAEGGELFRLLDTEEQVIPVSGRGIVASTILAGILDIKVGDEVRVEVLEGERQVLNVKVSGLVAEFAGASAYMNLDALNRMLREGPSLSGAYLKLDKNLESRIFTDLKERPGVAGVALKQATMVSFLDTFAETLLRMRTINILFASIIAIGVVYSSARIAFSERSRELATLRVIGLTRGEVSGIMLGELAVLTIVAIPFGLGIGYSLCALLAKLLHTEMYRIPLVVNNTTYGTAAITILAASLISGLIVRRNIDKLDMITALKVRE